jgi:hypothetical protein
MALARFWHEGGHEPNSGQQLTDGSLRGVVQRWGDAIDIMPPSLDVSQSLVIIGMVSLLTQSVPAVGHPSRFSLAVDRSPPRTSNRDESARMRISALS